MKKTQKNLYCLTVILFSVLFFNVNTAPADTIIFKDGTKIEVDTVWQDGDLAKTEKYGGIVSYPMSKIEKIVKGDIDYLEEQRKKAQAAAPKDKIDTVPEFIQVKEFSTKVVESSDEYVYVSWKTKIYSEKAGKVLISINFYNPQNQAVNNDLKEINLSLGDNVVADMAMISGDVYKNVSATGISIKEE